MATSSKAAEDLFAETGIRLFLYPRSNPDPLRCSFEVSVGVDALDFEPMEVAELIRDLAART